MSSTGPHLFKFWKLLQYIHTYSYLQLFNLAKKRYKDNFDTTATVKKIRNALNAGLMKIMSKMGIATIASYRNSALFDILGLNREIVEECFSGARVLLSGLGYKDIEARVERYHYEAYNKPKSLFPLNLGSFYKYLDGGEYHDYSPSTVHAIHSASVSGKKEDFENLKSIINNRDKKFIRDFFEFKSDRKAISIDEVEPKETNIHKDSSTAAMSLGSISPEAHECLA